MFRIVLIMSILVALQTTSVQADRRVDESDIELKRKIALHIQNLDAAEITTRSAARNALIALGPDILPLLGINQGQITPAQKQALQSIRYTLELQKAKLSTNSSLVTLSGSATLAQHCQKISKQTGNVINLTELTNVQRASVYEINVKAQKFWAVMDQVCTLSGTTFEEKIQNTNSSQQTLALNLYPANKSRIRPKPILYAGPCRIALQQLVLKPIIGDKPRRLLRTHWQVLCEPRLRPIYLQIDGRNFQAKTREGNLLHNRNPAAKYELPFSAAGGKLSEFYVDFEVEQSQRDSQIAFSAAMQMVTAAGWESFNFNQLNKPVQQTRQQGGVTITLLPLIDNQADQKQHSASMQMDIVYRHQGAAFESYRTWLLRNPISLSNAMGQRVSAQVRSQYALQAGSGARLIHSFQKYDQPIDKLSLVYKAPTMILNVPLSIKSKPIPIRTERTAP